MSGSRSAAEYCMLFRALSDPLRLEIVRQAAACTELPCTQLENTLPVTKSTISHHIKVLKHAGLLSVRREGKFFFYTLVRESAEGYLPGLLAQVSEWRPEKNIGRRKAHRSA